MSIDQVRTFNGLSAVDGSYLTQASDRDLAEAARSLATEQDEKAEEHQRELEMRHSQEEHAGVSPDTDTRDLAQTGWGIVLAHDADPRLLEALRPLLEHRREQATQEYEQRYREYFALGEDSAGKMHGGYISGESKMDFTFRNGAQSFGLVNPDDMPYYLLLVGSPEEIPFEFQYQLDVQYAVGRLYFERAEGESDDHYFERYARYAESVVQAETRMPPLPQSVAFFGVRNEDDEATITSADHLVTPLAREVLPAEFEKRATSIRNKLERAAQRNRPLPSDVTQSLNDALATLGGWDIRLRHGEETYKDDLARLLGGPETPALLFTASHGIGFPNGDERQLRHQGALVCQDWLGPVSHQGPITDDFYFSADDVSDDARLLGLVAFFFACYGGGTPLYDEFRRGNRKYEIAPRPFIAGLPQRLLCHPKGSALAAIAHVERAWGYSFMWERERQLEVFKETLTQLMISGQPIGAAMELFNSRYAEISSSLTSELHSLKKPDLVTPTIARLWTTNNDSRSYVILGDPAVKLPVAPNGTGSAASERATLGPVTLNLSGAGERTPAAVVVPVPASSEPAPAHAMSLEAAPAPQPPVVSPGSSTHAQLAANLGQLKEQIETLHAATRLVATLEEVIAASSALLAELRGPVEPEAVAARFAALAQALSDPASADAPDVPYSREELTMTDTSATVLLEDLQRLAAKRAGQA
jgi:hypothetical protein